MCQYTLFDVGGVERHSIHSIKCMCTLKKHQMTQMTFAIFQKFLRLKMNGGQWEINYLKCFSLFSKDLLVICVMVLVGYMLAGPTIFINYITRLLWRPHKLLLSNYGPCLGSCKWQPPRSPFASALVTDWYQYSGCPAMHVRGATL